MKTKRFLGVVLSVVMILSLFPVTSLAADGAACEVDGCTGTYTNGFCSVDSTHYEAPQKVSETHHPELNSTHSGYYAIENAGQLYWFANYVNTDTTAGTVSGYSGYYVYQDAVLTNDITVNANVLNQDGTLNSDSSSSFQAWTPIGQGTYFYKEDRPICYSGTFDGKGYTISGLYTNLSPDTTENKYVGVIGLYSKGAGTGTVKNLTVVDSYFSANRYVGGIVGCLQTGSIENCVNRASLKAMSSCGGITGDSGNAIYLTDCRNEGLITAARSAGGVWE